MPNSWAKRPKKNSHTLVKIGPGDTLAGRFFGGYKQKENRQTLEVWRFFLVEHSGLEPLTSTLPVWHSTN